MIHSNGTRVCAVVVSLFFIWSNQSDGAESSVQLGAGMPRWSMNPLESQVDVFAGGGASEDGGTFAAGATAAGRVGDAGYESIGTIVVMGGAPALRIRGTGELFPIHMTTDMTYHSSSGTGYLVVNLLPVSVNGQLTFNHFANSTSGNSYVTVSPEAALKFFHIYNNSFLLVVETRAGTAGVLAENGNEAGRALGPRFTGKVAIVSALGDFWMDALRKVTLSLDVDAHWMPTLVGNVDNIYEFAPGAQAAYKMDSGDSIYVRFEAFTHYTEVLPENIKGSSLMDRKNIAHEQPSDASAYTQYMGGAIGIHF